MSKRINYFNTLSQRAKLDQLARCRFMGRSEFSNGIAKIADKKIVIVGCGAQGLNQGLNMRDSGCDVSYASKLIQYGWETITEALKHGGITGMMDRLDNPSKMKAYDLAEELKDIMRPLYEKHQNDIITGAFSSGMMADWDNDDTNLLKWRAETAETGFEKTPAGDMEIPEQEYFDNAVLMVAQVKAGVELAFEQMTRAGMKPESAYYESLHETPLIANTIARRKLYEMNSVISDTAEYGCYLYDQECRPLLTDFMKKIDIDVIGKKFNSGDNGVDNRALNAVNKAIRDHPVEVIGRELRGYMTAMEKIAAGEKDYSGVAGSFVSSAGQ